MTNITQEERLEWREHFDEVVYQNNRVYNVLYHNVKKIKLIEIPRVHKCNLFTHYSFCSYPAHLQMEKRPMVTKMVLII